MFSVLPLWFASPAVQSALLIPLVLIALDALSGIAAAARLGDFNPRYVSSFMHTQVLPYAATAGSALMVALVSGQGVTGAALTMHAFLVLFYWAQLHSIASNLLELSGLPESTVIGGVRALLKAAFPHSLAATLPADAAPSGITPTSDPTPDSSSDPSPDGAAGVPSVSAVSATIPATIPPIIPTMISPEGVANATPVSA